MNKRYADVMSVLEDIFLHNYFKGSVRVFFNVITNNTDSEMPIVININKNFPDTIIFSVEDKNIPELKVFKLINHVYKYSFDEYYLRISFDKFMDITFNRSIIVPYLDRFYDGMFNESNFNQVISLISLDFGIILLDFLENINE